MLAAKPLTLPNISSLSIRGHDAPANQGHIEDAHERAIQKFKTYANSVPYLIEPNLKLQEMLDFILLRICQCVEAKDYEPGLVQWDSMLS
jgi:proteasome activator subunit 4